MWEPKFGILEMLEGKWQIAAVAFCVALVGTPIVRYLAYRLKVVDRPDGHLKPHARPVAYLGGVAICAGFLTGLVVYLAAEPGGARGWGKMVEQLRTGSLVGLLNNSVWNLLWIAAAGVLITIVGLIDDLRELRPMQKLFGQLAVGATLLIGGVGYRCAMVVFGPLGLAPPGWVVVPASLLMCLVIVVGACNATNLLDGLDGLCGGVSGIIALAFVALATWLATWGRFPANDPLRLAVCLAMAGAIFGFLPYNIPPASIFLGDAGSMLIGFFVATMMILFCHEGTARWLVGATAVFALPILDTSLAVVRRLRAGRSIFSADRNHLYDQLVDRGMRVRQVVIVFYLLAVATTGLGLTVTVHVPMRYTLLLYAMLTGVLFALFHEFGMLRPPEKEGR